MKNLIKKEFTFTALPITYLFTAFSLMAFIPGYPILMGSFFVCMGIFYSFQMAREGNDVVFSSLLPVKKQDIVKARYFFVFILEMGFMLLSLIFVILRLTVLKDVKAYTENPLMNANLAYLGYSLLVFAAFNGVFCLGFWKNAYKIGLPFLKFSVVTLIIVGIGETLHHFPNLKSLNYLSGDFTLQFFVLATGIIIFTAVTYFSCKSSMKSFNALDL